VLSSETCCGMFLHYTNQTVIYRGVETTVIILLISRLFLIM